MLSFSSCIEMMFRDLDFYDRPRAVKKTGIDRFEFWGWVGRDIPLLRDICIELDMRISCVCVDTENSNAREIFNSKKILYKESHDAFLSAVKESIFVARQLSIPILVLTVGQERNDITRNEQHDFIVSALKKATQLLEDAGVTLAIEPLNTICNHKGHYLYSSHEAFAICEEVGSASIKVLYDIYHQQIMEGNIISTICDNINLIGHIHVADVPGRKEPGTGELNYKNIFKSLADIKYQGSIGLEFEPSIDSAESIKQVLRLDASSGSVLSI